MAEEYGQDFEKLSNERASHDNLDDNDCPDAPADSHKMRLSVDIHSIKDTTFKGLVYAKYGALQSLGMFYYSIRVLNRLYRNQAFQHYPCYSDHKNQCGRYTNIHF